MSDKAPYTLTPEDVPVYVGQLDLSEPLADFEVPELPTERGYRRARLLVRLHKVPLGYVVLPPAKLSAGEVAKELWAQLGDEINAHLVKDGLKPLKNLEAAGIKDGKSPLCAKESLPDVPPLVSVVVCTRNRPAGAVAVLRDLMKQDYPNFEVVLVDNAPSNDETREAIEREFKNETRIRYILEPRPGLSKARNRGWNEAKGDIVAYTDDDVLVDPHWVNGVVRGFSRADHVGCVTGLVPSAEIENEVQLFFDQRVAWGTSCEPRIFDMKENRKKSVLYPYAGSDFGTGANFSFSKKALQEVGGFDEALGAGAVTGGGEDLDAFVKVLLSGWRLVYEPTAIIGHIHRSDVNALNRQIWTYGTGLTAFLCKYLVNPKTAPGILRGMPAGLMKVVGSTEKSTSSHILPRSVAYREVAGMLAGPFLYGKARWLNRRAS